MAALIASWNFQALPRDRGLERIVDHAAPAFVIGEAQRAIYPASSSRATHVLRRPLAQEHSAVLGHRLACLRSPVLVKRLSFRSGPLAWLLANIPQGAILPRRAPSSPVCLAGS